MAPFPLPFPILSNGLVLPYSPGRLAHVCALLCARANHCALDPWHSGLHELVESIAVRSELDLARIRQYLVQVCGVRRCTRHARSGCPDSQPPCACGRAAWDSLGMYGQVSAFECDSLCTCRASFRAAYQKYKDRLRLEDYLHVHVWKKGVRSLHIGSVQVDLLKLMPLLSFYPAAVARNAPRGDSARCQGKVGGHIIVDGNECSTFRTQHLAFLPTDESALAVRTIRFFACPPTHKCPSRTLWSAISNCSMCTAS